MVESRNQSSTGLMFDKEAVLTQRNHLARLMKTIFFKLKITHDDFVRMFSQWWYRSGQTTSMITNRGNLRRALEAEEPTIRTFFVLVFDVLNMDIIRLSMTGRSRDTGEVFTFHSDEVTLDSVPGEASLSNGESRPDVSATIVNDIEMELRSRKEFSPILEAMPEMDLTELRRALQESVKKGLSSSQ